MMTASPGASSVMNLVPSWPRTVVPLLEMRPEPVSTVKSSSSSSAAPHGARAPEEILVSLREVYHENGAPQGRRACAFTVEFRSSTRELQRGEVSMWQARMREALEWWSAFPPPASAAEEGAAVAFELR